MNLVYDAGVSIGATIRISRNNVYKLAIDTTREASDKAQAKSDTNTNPTSEFLPEETDWTTECSYSLSFIANYLCAL